MERYDIEEFYPSISEDLLKKATNYARTFVYISNDKEVKIFDVLSKIFTF